MFSSYRRSRNIGCPMRKKVTCGMNMRAVLLRPIKDMRNDRLNDVDMSAAVIPSRDFFPPRRVTRLSAEKTGGYDSARSGVSTWTRRARCAEVFHFRLQLVF